MPPPVIVDVWADNLCAEMDRISALAGTYKHVAVDTEYPGVVARPVGDAALAADHAYQTMRQNVDLLRLIQLGISLSDGGETGGGGGGGGAVEVACWQFNFQFSLDHDVYAEDSIDLLTKAGLDFARHEREGISVADFGELLTSSGLVLNDEIKWVCFHGGYDFAYMLKVLTGIRMPAAERDFFELLEAYFPQLYDIKYLMRANEALYGGLNRLAEHYSCERVGAMHQAGSDSLLTMRVFFAIVNDSFKAGDVDEKYEGILHGLGVAALPPLRSPSPKSAAV